MKRTRRKFSSAFKTKVVLEALSERYTMSELADRHKLHPNQISGWKSEFLSKASSVFEKDSKEPIDKDQQEKDAMLRVIGEQKIAIDFLKKSLR